MPAYDAAGSGASTIVLNLSQLDSIDTLGIGLLLQLLARARQRQQRLLAYGLSEECRRAFELTYLDQVVPLYVDEAEALVSEQQTKPSTARLDHWAEPVARLAVPHLPKEAINLNVQGRRPSSPVKGLGQFWQRTYQIRLEGATTSPTEVVAVWKERFASFWPPGSRYFGSGKPVDAGDVAVLNLAGPAGLVIATGIFVIYTGPESFCFLSVEGHMFGGMITFSAHEENGTSVAQVQALLRSSDPLYDIIVRLGIATKAEDQFWQDTLKNLAAHFGVEGQPVTIDALLLDPGMQWSQAKNLWHNSAIRTTLHMPVRWVRGLSAR
jgi:hypothetical protein